MSKTIDIPHIFVVSTTYELPFGPGKPFASNSTLLTRALVEGWTISGVTNYHSGDVRGPSVFNTDFSAFKKTRVGSSAFELRIDVFNVFNRAHFANPGTTFGNSTFGRIAATRLTPREVQVGFRFLF